MNPVSRRGAPLGRAEGPVWCRGRGLPLAVRLATRYQHRGEPDEDLRQEAALGLVQAVDGHRPGTGRGFLPYAVPTILGTLRHHFRDRSWSVRPPRRVQELTPRLRAVEEQLTQQLHRTPRPAEIAGEAGIGTADLLAIRQAARSCRAISMAEVDPADRGYPDPADTFAIIEDLLILGAGFSRLPPRLRLVVRLCFWEERTQKEIGETLGVSQMHVSRLLAQAIRRLRRLLPPASGGTMPGREGSAAGSSHTAARRSAARRAPASAAALRRSTSP